MKGCNLIKIAAFCVLYLCEISANAFSLYTCIE